ncbi:hypothetical protein I1A62_00155 (plasmid) [Rhodococcus sp. USK10]|nr:hypothetical protein [Rhodococcus sp. USK10]QYA99678.1 hypothetical protein I1A62_00155 [Rhodococcus sp. USK10]
MTAPDEPGLIASYPLAADEAPEDVLAANGWRVTSGDTPAVEKGYRIVDVEARRMGADRQTRDIRQGRPRLRPGRQDLAWRTALRDAMHNGGSATRLAAAAGVSRERMVAAEFPLEDTALAEEALALQRTCVPRSGDNELV